MKKLKHENLVEYFGGLIEGSLLYIILEFMEGGSLSDKLRQMNEKQETISEKIAKQYTKQILIALQYLHSNGIVHRDLKAANILFTKDGKLKLADFGESKQQEMREIGDTLELNSVVGTPTHMAPEIIRKSGHGRRVDVWSLGCTVIEILTGKPPFQNSVRERIFNTIICKNASPRIPSNISHQAKMFLRECFIIPRLRRPNCQELLRHPWIINDEQTKSSQPLEDSSSISNFEDFLNKFAETSTILQLTSNSVSLQDKRLNGTYLLIPCDVMFEILEQANYPKGFEILTLENVGEIFKSVVRSMKEFAVFLIIFLCVSLTI